MCLGMCKFVFVSENPSHDVSWTFPTIRTADLPELKRASLFPGGKSGISLQTESIRHMSISWGAETFQQHDQSLTLTVSGKSQLARFLSALARQIVFPT